MSSNNVILNFDEIDLNQYLVYNHLRQTIDFGQQLSKGLTLDTFLNGLIAKVSNNLGICRSIDNMITKCNEWCLRS